MTDPNEINLIELFSGIGGFTKGFEEAGFKIRDHYYSEIDKHAIANYKYNFPNAKYIGSVTDISGRDFSGINAITFGSPCQDFSIAGKGEGMEGKRSVLILEAIRLVSELRPDVFIWENVKGAFSSNSGADFWGILQAFANIGGYRLEWQLLNTKWFLPQNRERIYLVGHLATSKRGFGKVFPITEDDFGTNERAIQARSIRTLTAGGNSGGLHSSMTLVKSATAAGYEIATEGDSINLSNPNSETRRGRVGKQVAQTLDCACSQAVMIGAMRGRNQENPLSRESGLSTRQQLEINENGTSNTLTSVSKDNLVIQLNPSKESGGQQPYQQNRVFAKEGISPCLDQSAGRWQINTDNIRRLTEIECERLQGFPDDWTRYGMYEKQVWINKKEGTFEIIEGVKEIPKTERYRMCGNAVTVRAVKAIAQRLLTINNP